MATFIPVEAVEDDEPVEAFVPVEEVADDAVEPTVPRGTSAVPRRSAAPQLAEALQKNNLFGSATSALQGAWDKDIRRKPNGNWDLPFMAPVDPEAGVLKGMFQSGAAAINTGLQKAGRRLDDEGLTSDPGAIRKVFDDFQAANNLSDDEVAAAWSDLGIQNRTWEDGENLRIQSDGDIVPNPNSSTWLDPTAAEAAINASGASEEAKAAALSQLPQLAVQMASDKLGAYEAAATTTNFTRVPGSLIGVVPDRVTPPSEWAKEKGRTDVGSPQFILDYEADVKPGFVGGLAAKAVLSGNKLATQTLGTVGALTGLDVAGEAAARGSEGAATVNRGLADTGILGSIVEESLPIGAQILTGRGFAAFGKAAATLGTFASAGAQSAGLTFAEEIAAGTPEDEAREKAAKAGISTAIITSVFGTGAAGGVERLAAGVADDVTVGQLIQKAREQGINAAMPELRKFAGTVVKSAAGEGTEEGIDQLVGAFLTADPDTPLADAWEQATEAFTVGAAIGASTDVAMNMVQNAPLATAAALETTSETDEFIPTEELDDETPEPVAAPEAEAATTGDGVPTLTPENDGPGNNDPQTELPDLGGVSGSVDPTTPEAPATVEAAEETGTPGPAEAEPLTSGKGLDELGGAGKAMVENFYSGIGKSLTDTGEVPSAERNTRVGKAWEMVKSRGEPTVNDASNFVAAIKEAVANGDTAESWFAALDKAFPKTDETGTTAPPVATEPATPAEEITAAETPGDPAEGETGGAVEDVPLEVKSLPTDTTNENEEGQRQGRQEVLTPEGGVTLEGYHGTDAEFAEFSDEASEYGGVFFYDTPEPAKFHGSRVVKAQVSLKNPKRLDAGTYDPVEWVDGRDHDDIRQAKAEGYDGVIVEGQGPKLIVTFNSAGARVDNTPSVAAETASETGQSEPEVAKEAAYSRDALKTAFNLDDDQATAADALVQALGLDTTAIRVRKGGVPGAGLGEVERQGTLEQRPGKKPRRGNTIHGSHEVLADGDSLIRGLTNPDVSTALHELAHVARRQLLNRDNEVPGITPEDIEVAELWAGAKDGVWDVKAEEKFARGFEQYLRDGKAPAPELATVFDRIGEWLKSIYKTIKGTSLDVKITPAMRRVLDDLVKRNAPVSGTAPGSPDSSTVPADLTAENQQSTLPPAPSSDPGEIAPSELPPEGTPDSPAPGYDPSLTSVKNAATDAELAAFGFDPIAAPAQKALQESWDQALARFAAKPTVGADLTTELNTKPRATNDVEHGILLKELADRKLAYGQTQRALEAAVKSGDEAAITEAHRQNDLARDAVYNVITAAKATGTVWGRAGRFRQLAIDEDYSLVQMEAKFRTEVNMGKPLTKDQAAEVKVLHDQIAAANKALEDYKTKAAEDLARAVHEATLEALRKAKPKLRKALGSKISEAQKRLRDLGIISPDADPEFLAQEDFPPEVIEDLATVAAGWMVDNALTPEQFEARLKRAFGDRVAAQAEVIRARSREIIDSTIDETFANADEDTPRKKVPKTRDGIVESVDAEKGITGNDVFQLARLHINEGVDGFENVMKAVLADLQQVFPDLTLREVHDAYSGYGKTVFPSKEADLVKLREYRTLARLTSQLEDATKAQAPKRTGMQRDKPSERVRTLQKQVRDMMRKMGIDEVSDDKRLKSSLDSVKTRLRNEIEELEVAIKNRAPRPEGSKGVAYDDEANALKAQRDTLKAEYQEIFGKKELTDGDRIRMTVKALERRIEETEKLIAAGKSKRDTAARSPVTSPEIEALRAKLGGLNEQRNALRDREAERLERTKKLTENRIKKLKERIAKGDYAPAKKLPPVKPDAELGKLQKDEIEVKREFNEKLLNAQLARRSRGAKIYDAVIEVFNASRSIITSADVSAVLRQGGFIAFGNPLRALRAIPAMFKAGFSEDFAKALATDIENNPYFVQSQKAKLFLSEFGDTHHFSKMEEAFRGRLAKKIPGVGKVVEFSERTYTAFLNKLRMDSFEAMARSVSPTGDLTDAEAKVIANFINIATGRGNLERYDKAAEVLAAAFFSPKYVVSRFQLLAMPLTGFRAGHGASMRTRKAIAAEYGKTLAGVLAVYALVALMDDDDDEVSVEKDPRSSDFGKIKIGNTRVDFMFGLLQATVLLSRLSTGEKKTAGGDVVPIRGEDAGFGQSPAGVFGQFMRTKLAPVPSAVVNMIDGRDVVGNKVFWETELAGNLMPLSMGDIFTTMKEQGIPAGSALAVLALFGAGASSYGDDDIKPLEQDIMTKFFRVDPERYED